MDEDHGHRGPLHQKEEGGRQQCGPGRERVSHFFFIARVIKNFEKMRFFVAKEVLRQCPVFFRLFFIPLLF
jgi:hypothetical protein